METRSCRIPNRPTRLAQVFQRFGFPLYFVTFCTFDRHPMLANAMVLESMQAAARKLESAGNALGRFVIMPEHLHAFIRIGPEENISMAVRCIKAQINKTLRASGHVDIGKPVRQPGLFDHLMRTDESYAEKWAYVRDNPVRALCPERRQLALAGRNHANRSGVSFANWICVIVGPIARSESVNGAHRSTLHTYV